TTPFRSPGFAVNLTRTVPTGDVIYFRLNDRNSSNYDGTSWNPTVTFVPAPTTTYKASQGFSGTQGQNQWYYQQWNGSAYTNLFGFDATNQRWYGAGGGYPYIWVSSAH